MVKIFDSPNYITIVSLSIIIISLVTLFSFSSIFDDNIKTLEITGQVIQEDQSYPLGSFYFIVITLIISITIVATKLFISIKNEN